jgi:hypothetical protein
MTSWTISYLNVINTKIITGMKMQDLYHQEKKIGVNYFLKNHVRILFFINKDIFTQINPIHNAKYTN